MGRDVSRYFTENGMRTYFDEHERSGHANERADAHRQNGGRCPKLATPERRHPSLKVVGIVQPKHARYAIRIPRRE